MIKIVSRTLFFYIFIMFLYRIMGKREIAKLGIIDLIVSILIAELVAISIENYNDSILNTVIPIITLAIIEIILGNISVKKRKINKILEGKPRIIIDNGKIKFNNLVKERYSIDDLLLELRQKEIASIDEVEYAYLEPNGKLSIFKYQKDKINPFPVIIEGIIQEETLNSIKKSKKWLENLLDKNNIDIKNIFYAVYKNNNIYIIKYNHS